MVVVAKSTTKNDGDAGQGETPAEWQKIRLRKVGGASMVEKQQPAPALTDDGDCQLANARKLLSPPPAPATKVSRKNPAAFETAPGSPEFVGFKLKQVVKPADYAPSPEKEAQAANGGGDLTKEKVTEKAAQTEQTEKIADDPQITTQLDATSNCEQEAFDEEPSDGQIMASEMSSMNDEESKEQDQGEEKVDYETVIDDDNDDDNQ